MSDPSRPQKTFFSRDIMPAVKPDLIPPTSWGSSLANLLTRESWDGIRLPVIGSWDNRCQLCGKRHHRTECHEIWAYSLPSAGAAEGTVGVQRLIGLASLCKPDHMTFHLGYAKITGVFGAVKARLMATNRWEEEDFDRYYKHAGQLLEQRNAVFWVLDLSLVRDDAKPLMIRPDWTLQEDGFLFRPAARGQTSMDSWTVIFGAPYVVANRLMPALSPQEALDGLMPEAGDFDFVRHMGDSVRIRGR